MGEVTHSKRGPSLRRAAAVSTCFGMLALLPALLPAPVAAASTAVQVSVTFAEPIQAGLVQGCPISPRDGLCGSGEVVPFGHATDTVVFGGACGGDCDLRTINLPQGVLISHETFSNPTCPGACTRGAAFGTLTDEIVGGTGLFAGATGELAGSVTGAGTAGVPKLSGTLILS